MPRNATVAEAPLCRARVHMHEPKRSCAPKYATDHDHGRALSRDAHNSQHTHDEGRERYNETPLRSERGPCGDEIEVAEQNEDRDHKLHDGAVPP